MEIPKEVIDELFEAMNLHIEISHRLIEKLILETDQPEKEEIAKGNYYELQNAPLINGQEELSENWWFEVHGEHCLFINLKTSQKLEVSLGIDGCMENLDPYFFYNFLETTEKLKHLTSYFEEPFRHMYNFFKELEEQNLMTHIHRSEFRKN